MEEDLTIDVRRMSKEEILAGRRAMTVMRIMLLIKSPSWGKLLDIDCERVVCPGPTCGKS